MLGGASVPSGGPPALGELCVPFPSAAWGGPEALSGRGERGRQASQHRGESQVLSVSGSPRPRAQMHFYSVRRVWSALKGCLGEL